MKILVIVSSLGIGGIETTLLHCLRYFKDRNVEIHVLCRMGRVLDEEFKTMGAQIINIGKYKNPFCKALRLYTVLKRGNYEVVHSRDGFFSGLYALVCKLYSIPFIVSIHNCRVSSKLHWEDKLFLRLLKSFYLKTHRVLTISLATKIVGHSKANLYYFTDNFENKSKYCVIYNGIDFSRLDSNQELDEDKQRQLYSFVRDSKLTFIHIGSFRVQKNHNLLIDIFNSLNPLLNNYKLILLGAGQLLNEIQQKVFDLGIQTQVYFVGLEINIFPYLKLSNLFIFPSIHEGFGNVLIEAQYAGIPVFASNIPPHYEAIYSNYHKYFFDPKDKMDALEKLKSLIEDINSTEIKQDIEDAYRFAKQFSVKTMADNLSDLYESIIYS